VFLPRVGARALRAPIFFGSLTRKKGALRAPGPSQLHCFLLISQKLKMNYFKKQNASLQA
jgi:hypothetical protein